MDISHQLLTSLKIPPFRPIMCFHSGKAQTIAAYLYPRMTHINSHKCHFVTLPDGDTIALTENRPTSWKPDHRTILLVHGLNGSSLSYYMVRIARVLVQRGYQVIRMDLRGCGAGRGKAKQPYHSGRSEDTRSALQWLAQRYPHSPVTQIGFSLGANMTLKMAGEDGNIPSGNLDSLIAVSPPMDLYSCVKKLLAPANRIFEQHFVKDLLQDVKLRKREHPDLPFPSFPSVLNIYEFDDLYTAPVCGFENALDYYARSSALPWMSHITIPSLILHANDDPVVCNAAFERLPNHSNLNVLLTAHGGHVGWIGPSGNFYRYGYQWMDHVLVEWIKHFKQIPS